VYFPQLDNSLCIKLLFNIMKSTAVFIVLSAFWMSSTILPYTD